MAEQEKKKHQACAQDAYKNAIEYKNQGNEFFKKNELEKALSKYARAFLFLQAIDKANNMPEETKNLTSKEEQKKWDTSEQQKKEIQDLKHSIYLNQALIFIKKKNWGRADIKANLALKIKKSAKGFFRRAQARVQTNDPEGAVDDLKQANQLDPGNQEIIDEFAKVKARVPEILKKQSQMFDLYKNQKKEKKMQNGEVQGEVDEQEKAKQQKGDSKKE